ncbi:hypothetical protein SKAU_G00430720, partial [Synaphobranchus kaupii]
MESRFAHLSQRDSSVPMLRVKMSRRRSQAQKENRDLAVSRHRGLNRLPELGVFALDVSVVGQLEEADHGAAMSAKRNKNLNVAVEERKKMLARYKEAKELQKDKERRAKEKMGGVFKVGVYKPQPLASLPQAPARTKPLAEKRNVSAPRKAEPAVKPVVKPVKPRAAQKPPPVPPAGGRKTAPVERTARVQGVKATKKPQTAPPPGRGKTAPDNAEPQSQAIENKPVATEGDKVEEGKVEMLGSAGPPEGGEKPSKPENMEDKRPPSPSSFAPQGFVFEPPTGLSSFLSAPLDDPSADAFLASGPSRDDAPAAVVSDPPPTPQPSPQSPSNSQGPLHDIPYFRAVMASETGRLMGLCEQWDPRAEESSIPEEMRERVRTAVGQARLLMRQRFGQFQGLVDDCALGRGEKITTCTDLQGFWDMVFYQVEDVNRKFSLLKEVESRGWQEEHKPLPRIKRASKKAPLAAGNAAVRGGATAAARSRLAAVKAAMKAKQEAVAQRAAERPAGEASSEAPADAQSVVFHGGFFQVESPAKLSGSMRRTSLLRVAPSPCSSPCPPPRFSTPRRLHPAASRPSPAPGVTPARQTNSALFGSLCLTPRPQPSPCSTAPPGSPPPTRAQNAEREDRSGVPDHDTQPIPCPMSPAVCPVIPAPCPVNPAPCPVSPAVCSVIPTPCPVRPAVCSVNPAVCPVSPAVCSVIPAPCPVSPAVCSVIPAPCPVNPAPCPVSLAVCSVSPAPCPVNPALCLVSPAPTPQSDPVRALSNGPPGELEMETASQFASLAPSPQNVTSQSGIGQVHSEPLLLLAEGHSQSKLVPELKDASCGQSELVAEPELEGSPPALSVALTPCPQVEAVEDVGQFLSPCQRSDYSPSQWQELNFTLSPSAYPSTPTRELLLSPDDSSPMAQSPPFTPGPLPLPMMSEMPGCVNDRSPQAAAHVQTDPAAETSDAADVPGLDFDCCVQPSVRCGPSPRATVPMETWPSPGTTVVSDVQMESPERGPDDGMAGEAQVDA